MPSTGSLAWHLYFEGLGYWPYRFRTFDREFHPECQSDWNNFLKEQYPDLLPGGLWEKFPTGVMAVASEELLKGCCQQ